MCFSELADLVWQILATFFAVHSASHTAGHARHLSPTRSDEE
jgi:hypothetical protein